MELHNQPTAAAKSVAVIVRCVLSGTGNTLNNILNGNSAANVLNGGGGADKLAGGRGNDVYLVNVLGDSVIELAGGGTDRINSGLSWTLGADLENLALTGAAASNGTGNELNNVITGNAAVNTLNGGAGDDVLDGGSGADMLIGGTGNDTYAVDDAADIVMELAGGGLDTVNSAITFTVGANVENLVLTGTAAVNGTGNSLANNMTGNAAANSLNGGTGADAMAGGDGNDVYVVDNSADSITEIAGQGTDRVNAGRTWTLGADIENLTLTGTASINGTGNALNNLLTGNGAINQLAGGDGIDTFRGGSGADVLAGGLGNDRFEFYTIDDGGDVISDFSSSATGNNDILRFSGMDFGGLAVGSLTAEQFSTNATGAATTVAQRFIYETDTGILRYDADGNAGSAAVVIATLTGAPVFVIADIGIM